MTQIIPIDQLMHLIKIKIFSEELTKDKDGFRNYFIELILFISTTILLQGTVFLGKLKKRQTRNGSAF